jgi:asparagine synthase (glutamine-hydrolysing)
VCGIAGYYGTRELDQRVIDRCLERMRHRGPDHQAAVSFDNGAGRNAYLLAARLDIIDLQERSNQPMRVGSKTIAYNGELYNYVEVREKLKARGRTFATTSDTEVMLTALDDLGPVALDDCEGMWAFALYDEDDGSLLLSRDRFGEKPLWLYRDDTGLYFGSEPSFVFELLGRRLDIDLNHLQRYLVNGYRALYKQPGSFFVGLEELAPAMTLQIDREGRERVEPYWSVTFDPDDDMSYDDAVSLARDAIIRAVELRLRADVPLAFCMSGGVDSVSLISTAKKVFGYDVHGFTIVNEDERYEEQDMVDYAVADLGIRHTSVELAPEGFLPNLRKIVAHRCAPLYTISYYAHWLLMRAIHENGYRVSVSGSAADEMFSGYYDHHLAYLRDVRAEPALHAASVEAWREHVLPQVRNPYLQNPDLFTVDPDQRNHLYLNADRFATHLRTDWFEPFVERTYTDEDLLRNRMLNELFHESVPPILHEDDLNAMSFSIENRSPYLDRPLVELTMRIPTRHLIRDAYAKAILRDAMRGIAPDGIVDNRRKVGFNAPINDLLDPNDPETREAVLGDSPIYDIVEREAIEELLDKDFLPNSESKFLFSFVNAKLFMEEFGA